MTVTVMSRFDGDTRVTITAPITKRRGVAGSFSVTAKVHHEYSDGSDEHNDWTVTGSEYGGPVVAHTAAGQVFVTDPERFGSIAADPREWLRRFVLNEVM